MSRHTNHKIILSVDWNSNIHYFMNQQICLFKWLKKITYLIKLLYYFLFAHQQLKLVYKDSLLYYSYGGKN